MEAQVFQLLKKTHCTPNPHSWRWHKPFPLKIYKVNPLPKAPKQALTKKGWEKELKVISLINHSTGTFSKMSANSFSKKW